MTKNDHIGTIGEGLAWEYLKNKGYQILAKNYRQKFGEIDIIVRAPDLTLVFIEVKTLIMKTGGGFSPEDNFTKQKSNKVKRICEFFAAKYPNLIDEDAGWRIDVIALEILKADGSIFLRHYQNI